MPEQNTQEHKTHHRHHHHSLLDAQSVTFVKSGDDYFTRAVDIINRSQRKLHLQTYIFIDDETGKSIIEALQKAVARGVEVFLLVDAFGSFAMSNHAIHTIKKSGIQFRTFSPLFANHWIQFGRRLHHKILVADQSEALIGGINIEDKYHFKKNENTPWLDFAVYITGPVCQHINSVCEHLWKGKLYRKKRKTIASEVNAQTQIPGIHIKIRQNDWARRKEGVSRSLRNAIKSSHETITIIGSYFLPGRRIRKLLRNASRRGVKIKLILQGASDVSLVKNATTWWYAWLMRNNIEIFEWDKTVLHGKLTLIDKHWVSVGSYNINHLSDYASIETNAEIHDKAFCDTVLVETERIMGSSQRVTVEDYHKLMTTFEQFSCWVSFRVIRILFWVQFLLLSKE